MSTGWGCQHLTKNGEITEWCRLLKKTCSPGQHGCVLYGEFVFSDPNATVKKGEERKVKKRSDNPLGR